MPQVAVGFDRLLGGVDRLEEGHADAHAAGTAVECAVAHHDAGLDERATLEDFFADVAEKFGTRYKIGEEGSPGVVLERSCHDGLLKRFNRPVLLRL